jgi:hypothetical protein
VAGRDDEGRGPRDGEYPGARSGDGADEPDGYDDDAPWTDADEQRYQARRDEELKRGRRRRRQATSFAVLVLLVLGIGVGAAGVYQGWWQWPFGREEPAAAPEPTPTPCPTPEVTAAQPADVSVTVLNGTGERGLAARVSGELEDRGYVVADIGNTQSEVTDIAQVRHGPEGLTAARSVAAQVDGSVLVDDGRTGGAVDLALGAGYTALRPLEVVTPLLEPAPAESPAGCVPASAPPQGTTEPSPTTEAPAEPAPTT